MSDAYSRPRYFPREFPYYDVCRQNVYIDDTNGYATFEEAHAQLLKIMNWNQEAFLRSLEKAQSLTPQSVVQI